MILAVISHIDYDSRPNCQSITVCVRVCVYVCRSLYHDGHNHDGHKPWPWRPQGRQ